MKSSLDKFDRKILSALQGNAELSVAELGEQVGLSQTPCWRRIKNLEESGLITRGVTLVNPRLLGLGVTVYAYITIKSHNEDSLRDFESAVQTVENVVECYSTTGEKDYVLKVLVNNVEEYEQLLKRTLVHLPNVASVNSTFALKQVKYTTRLPIPDA